MNKCLALVFALVTIAATTLCTDIPANDALRIAASQNKIEGIQEALRNGADINSTTPDGKTALMLAAFFGKLATTQFLIEHRADINRRDSKGATALIYAAMRSNPPDVAFKLIKAGADLNVKDNDGFTALMYTGNSDIKKLIRASGGKEFSSLPRWGAHLDQQPVRTSLRNGTMQSFGAARASPSAARPSSQPSDGSVPLFISEPSSHNMNSAAGNTPPGEVKVTSNGDYHSTLIRLLILASGIFGTVIAAYSILRGSKWRR